MKDERICPKCLSSRMVIRTSKRVGDWQEQRLVCRSCGATEVRSVDARLIFRRKVVSNN